MGAPFFAFSLCLFLLAFSFLGFGSINEVSAQPQPLEDLGVPYPDGSDGFAPYVSGIINLLIGVAAVLAVIFVAIGGVQYVLTDSVSGKEAGKETVTNALLGLLIALAAWLILYTINPDILNLELDPSGAPPAFEYEAGPG